MLSRVKVLCCADDRGLRDAVPLLLERSGNFECRLAGTEAEGLEALEGSPEIRLVLIEQRLVAGPGARLLQQLHARWPEKIIILLTAEQQMHAPGSAAAGQVFSALSSEFQAAELLATLSGALKYQELHRENSLLHTELVKKNSELQRVNQNLEELVDKRTEALEIRNRVLQVSQGILDVLPVVVIGIDPEDFIVSCNEYARDLFPCGGIGPFGQDRRDVFSPEINGLIDRLEYERAPGQDLEVRHQKFRGEVRRLHESLSQGVVLVLIPES